MAEYNQKTDKELAKENLLLELGEILSNAEKEDFKRQRKKSPLEIGFETILAVSLSLVAGLLFSIALVVLLLYLIFRNSQIF